jgi:membrane associated rhomboid family serine protease
MFRNIPTVTRNLLIVNFLAFVASWIFQSRGMDLEAIGGLHFFISENFHLFQFITYQFLHANMTHIFFNMFALWMFGCVVERVWGARKFLFYYIFCGIGAGVIQELVQWATMSLFPDMQVEVRLVGGGTTMIPYEQYLLYVANMVGASGAVYAVLLAFGMIFPNERIFIFPLPVPIKAKWLVMGYVALELFYAISNSGDEVAHIAHLGGMLFGFLMIRYWNRHPGASYNRSRGEAFFENLKRNFEKRSKGNPNMHVEEGGSREADMEFNARKKHNQEEIDAILDKIRKSGYDSLSKEEKQKLFDASRNL